MVQLVMLCIPPIPLVSSRFFSGAPTLANHSVTHVRFLLSPSSPSLLATHTRSEKKLRRLEVATISPKLSKLQLYRLLSHSESRWVGELSSAGLTPEGQLKPGERGDQAHDYTFREACGAF
jgi:hypothetical protein